MTSFFLPELVQNSYRLPVTRHSIPANSTKKIVTNNPNRVQLVITNLKSNVVFLNPEPPLGQNEGLFRTAKRISYIFSILEDFELCKSEWYATSGSTDTALYVLESINTEMNR